MPARKHDDPAAGPWIAWFVGVGPRVTGPPVPRTWHLTDGVTETFGAFTRNPEHAVRYDTHEEALEALGALRRTGHLPLTVDEQMGARRVDD